MAQATAETDEGTFVAADLIGSAGVGSNGDKLIATLDDAYPQELQRVLLLRENRTLMGELRSDRQGAFEKVSKIAGREVADVAVRGGADEDGVNIDSDAAWVTYAVYDDRGDIAKGGFPYRDFGKSSSDEHVSQLDQLQESAAARDHRFAKAKADAATGDGDDGKAEELQAEVERLQAELDAAQDPEPFSGYREANAKDLVARLGEADRDTAQRALAYEQAHENRKTVTEAAEKRVTALDAEADDAEALRARVAELEAQLQESAAADSEKPAKA